MLEALSYDDVLLVPQFSNIESRSSIDISSNLGKTLRFQAPIIASPMDTISGFDMGVAMSSLGGVAIIHRYNTLEEQAQIVRSIKRIGERVGAAVGTSGDYMERAAALVSAGVDFICIDVAHGHHFMMRDAIKNIRAAHSNALHIMAGNVATADGFKYLEDWGANSIRVGIGGGCFVPDTEVITAAGIKNIQDVKVGDQVLTHDGSFRSVINTLKFDRNEEIVSINGIECTKNHEFYIIPKEVSHLVNEDNIHEYAKWIEAWELDKEKHLLIELENNY